MRSVADASPLTRRRRRASRRVAVATAVSMRRRHTGGRQGLQTAVAGRVGFRLGRRPERPSAPGFDFPAQPPVQAATASGSTGLAAGLLLISLMLRLTWSNDAGTQGQFGRFAGSPGAAGRASWST